METAAHHALKRLARAYLRECGCQAVATEVRCPISRYRIDVAGYLDSVVVNQATGHRQRCQPLTIVIECKQSRADFLRDAEHMARMLQLRERLDQIRRSIEENRIKSLEPQLRCSGSSLFTEMEQWDFAASRLPAYRTVLRRLRRADEKLHGQTKFFLIAHYRLADRLYVASPRGMIQPSELPPGWGLLECPPKCLSDDEPGLFEASELSVAVNSPERGSKPAFRSRLLRNIAVSASWAAERRSMICVQERARSH